MKIVITQGCMAWDTSIDGISNIDDEFNQTEVINYLLPKIGERLADGKLSLEDIYEIFPDKDDRKDDGVSVLLRINDKLASGEINLERVIRLFPSDSYEDDGIVCEACGDTVSTETWDI